MTFHLRGSFIGVPYHINQGDRVKVVARGTGDKYVESVKSLCTYLASGGLKRKRDVRKRSSQEIVHGGGLFKT